LLRNDHASESRWCLCSLYFIMILYFSLVAMLTHTHIHACAWTQIHTHFDLCINDTDVRKCLSIVSAVYLFHTWPEPLLLLLQFHRLRNPVMKQS
jgi:hypothetical protein